MCPVPRHAVGGRWSGRHIHRWTQGHQDPSFEPRPAIACICKAYHLQRWSVPVLWRGVAFAWAWLTYCNITGFSSAGQLGMSFLVGSKYKWGSDLHVYLAWRCAFAVRVLIGLPGFFLCLLFSPNQITALPHKSGESHSTPMWLVTKERRWAPSKSWLFE